MAQNLLVQFLTVAGILLGVYGGTQFVNYLRKKRTNTELWATVFEGLTHKTMNLEPLKEPKVFIEKRVKKDGQDIGNDGGRTT